MTAIVHRRNDFPDLYGVLQLALLRYNCGMAPVMSRHASRERAKEAFELRASRHSWREVADRLGYRSVGAAQTAVARHVARERREPSATSVEAHKFAIETRTRAMSQRFAAAFRNGDDDTLVTLNREIRANEIELAKLGGFYAPEQVDVNVTHDATAIIDRMESELLALVANRPPQNAIGGTIIDADVEEIER
ncbi:hypothetical protein C3473_28280 [Mycobacterium kansasii]|uniref:hypothetical protein n=1 Tax=Mycobacterium kansasii TaxID=1768 RepID=UPI000CDE35A1|nr:hypothetical protein [Mycobacterium kansasii]POX87612.1 hypothetical protein C3473_28280 [Mycobacterium kansasii]